LAKLMGSTRAVKPLKDVRAWISLAIPFAGFYD